MKNAPNETIVATKIKVQLRKKRSVREVVLRVLDVSLVVALDEAILGEDDEDKRNLKTAESEKRKCDVRLAFTKGNAAFIVAERLRAVK